MAVMPFPWLKDKPDTLRRHLDHPEVDAETYIRQRRVAHGRRLMSMRRIYLDTKYWVCLREVLMGRGSQTQQEIFGVLQKLRDDGKIICPVSYSVFVELLRQTDLETRTATARAIDIFGESSCVQAPHEVLNQEVLAFAFRAFQKMLQNIKPIPVHDLIWSKASFIVGEHALQLKGCAPEIADAMAKAMDDLFWSVSLEEMVSVLPPDAPTRDLKYREAFAEKLTRGKNKARREADTFDRLFLDEVAGGLEAHERDLGEIMVYLRRKFGFKGKVTRKDKKMAGHSLAKLIRAAFEHRRISTDIPGIHISSGLHAAVRFDRDRKYKANDCEDFRHAVVALPYYDIFCTEKSLRHLVCHKPLEFDKAYRTQVVSNDDEVLAVLKMVA